MLADGIFRVPCRAKLGIANQFFLDYDSHNDSQYFSELSLFQQIQENDAGSTSADRGFVYACTCS